MRLISQILQKSIKLSLSNRSHRYCDVLHIPTHGRARPSEGGDGRGTCRLSCSRRRAPDQISMVWNNDYWISLRYRFSDTLICACETMFLHCLHWLEVFELYRKLCSVKRIEMIVPSLFSAQCPVTIKTLSFHFWFPVILSLLLLLCWFLLAISLSVTNN